MSIFADAGSHSIEELMAMARDAALNEYYLIILGGAHVTTHDLIAITSVGGGYVSFQLEPSDGAGGL